jgi:hypothetical protein
MLQVRVSRPKGLLAGAGADKAGSYGHLIATTSQTMALTSGSKDQFGDTRPEGLMHHHFVVSLDTCRCCATMPLCIENLAV